MKKLDIEIGTSGSSTTVKVDGDDVEMIQHLSIEVDARNFTLFSLEGMLNPTIDRPAIELKGYYLSRGDFDRIMAFTWAIRDHIEVLGEEKMEEYPALRQLYVDAKQGIEWMPPAK